MLYIIFCYICVRTRRVLLYSIGHVKNYAKWGTKYHKAVIVKKKFLQFWLFFILLKVPHMCVIFFCKKIFKSLQKKNQYVYNLEQSHKEIIKFPTLEAWWCTTIRLLTTLMANLPLNSNLIMSVFRAATSLNKWRNI